MKIIKIWAGLGNQMFQYALYRSLLEQFDDVYVDTSYYQYLKAHNGYELEKIFNIKPVHATQQQCLMLAENRMDKFHRFFRKYIYHKNTQFIPPVEKAICYLPRVFENNNMYYQGYWQSECYFKNIKKEIYKDFCFPTSLTKENLKVAEIIKKTNSVAVHVRRGDYITAVQKNMETDYQLGGVCTKEYYINSISYIKRKIASPYFFVFSDDINWCKNNFNEENMIYIDWNKGANSYKDMQLMSYCKYNIISNSTFSWWGAWLNAHPDKIVIAPNKWYKNGHIGDIIPDEWIKMEVD